MAGWVRKSIELTISLVVVDKKFLYALTKHESLIATYKVNDYVAAGVYNIELIKNL